MRRTLRYNALCTEVQPMLGISGIITNVTKDETVIAVVHWSQYTTRLKAMHQEKQLHIRLPKDIYMKLKVQCVCMETSIQEFVLGLVMESVGATQAGQSLLIVEYDAIMRDSMKDELSKTHEVVAVESAEDALDILQERDFDVLLTDVRLPGMSGVDLVKAVKALKPHVSPVLITAHPSVDLAMNTMKHGAFDYLVKPVTLDMVESVLYRLAATGRIREG